jgi:hypothetical protein
LVEFQIEFIISADLMTLLSTHDFRRDRKRQTYEDRRAEREALKEEAAERTAEAEQLTEELRRVLISIVEASPAFVIAKQRIVARFSEPEPPRPNYHDYPREPKREDWTFIPEFDLFDKLFAFRRNKKVRISQEKAENGFLRDYAQWSEKCKSLQKANEELHKDHMERLANWHGPDRQGIGLRNCRILARLLMFDYAYAIWHAPNFAKNRNQPEYAV